MKREAINGLNLENNKASNCYECYCDECPCAKNYKNKNFNCPCEDNK